jgi:hypothetical protein
MKEEEERNFARMLRQQKEKKDNVSSFRNKLPVSIHLSAKEGACDRLVTLEEADVHRYFPVHTTALHRTRIALHLFILGVQACFGSHKAVSCHSLMLDKRC